jgi:hypothetical protein
LIGALIVAAAAAGITALVLNSVHSKAAGAGSAPPSASPTAATSSAPASPSPNSPSPADTATAGTGTATGTGNQNLGDPAADPVGYVEAMRSQIDGFIAQGQDTIDPNAGRDLQNSLSDLENAITTAQNNGGGRQQQRAVRQKIDAIDQKINNDLDNGDISQDAANQLAGELQNLANAMANNNGGNN